MRGLVILSALLLPACSLFDNSDPREGVEALAACHERVSDWLVDQVEDTSFDGEALVTPTYTFDVTKVSADDLRTLIVPGSDETAGSRGMAATNRTSTAMSNFESLPVDEKGAFFFGQDPSLYRVRGEPVALEDAARTGCERQLEGMRLTAITLQFDAIEPEPGIDTADTPDTSLIENDS
ncbi:hypothetical protein [Qipengyuania nanhaisediminis]|uniref:hypothetical protein n=1 Tax=Qipengyuania nanhaisediminis TaxID=604088 RepID=UPI0038B36879